MSLDGDRTKSHNPNTVGLLLYHGCDIKITPGHHTVVVRYFQPVSGYVQGSVSSGDLSVSFYAEPGQSYHLDYEITLPGFMSFGSTTIRAFVAPEKSVIAGQKEEVHEQPVASDDQRNLPLARFPVAFDKVLKSQARVASPTVAVVPGSAQYTVLRALTNGEGEWLYISTGQQEDWIQAPSGTS